MSSLFSLGIDEYHNIVETVSANKKVEYNLETLEGLSSVVEIL